MLQKIAHSLTSFTICLHPDHPNKTMASTIDFEMDVGSSSHGAALLPTPQTVTKAVGAPYRKRAKNAVLINPALEQIMGSKERALDVRYKTLQSDLN